MLKSFLKKAFLLMNTLLHNPSYFRYRVRHGFCKYMSYKNARKISNKNLRQYKKQGIRDLVIETYDGSNQFVHPDIDVYNDICYLVVTPYPYGMDEYENPSVYYGKTLKNLIAFTDNPIAFPSRHVIGYHLSDPCIIFWKDRLLCFYRESVPQNGGEKDTVYCLVCDHGKWFAPKVVITSCTDSLLSPAVIEGTDKNLYMFHVSKKSGGNVLMRSILGRDFAIVRQQSCEISGIPALYDIWHLSVVYDNLNKRADDKENCLFGLFLLKCRKKVKQNSFLLYAAHCETNAESNGKWVLEYLIDIPESVRSIMKFPYKSCINVKSGDLILNFRDKKDRYRAICISREEWCKR